MMRPLIAVLLAALLLAILLLLPESPPPPHPEPPLPGDPPSVPIESTPPDEAPPAAERSEEPPPPPTGVVLDEVGRPVQGAAVTLDWPAAARVLWPVPSRSDKFIRTDRRGRFRWQGKRPAAEKRWFAVHRYLGVGSASAASPGSDEPVEIRLWPGLRIDVEVLEPDRGHPDSLEVSLVSRDRDPWAPTADLPRAYVPEISRVTGSEFSLPGLSGHGFTLWIRAPGYRPRELPSREILPGPGMRRRKVEVALEEGFTISGRVLDDEGMPVPKATVHVNDGGKPRYQTEPFWCLHGRTDEEGRFSVGGLADGVFLIRVHSVARKTSAVVATGVRAGTTGLELKLAGTE